MQFPIDVSGVQNDHPFLDADSLQSLFRRLTALNRCATMKLEHHHHQKRNVSIWYSYVIISAVSYKTRYYTSTTKNTHN